MNDTLFLTMLAGAQRTQKRRAAPQFRQKLPFGWLTLSMRFWLTLAFFAA